MRVWGGIARRDSYPRAPVAGAASIEMHDKSGRVKVCHLRQGLFHRVGPSIPGAGITEELAHDEPTQDGNRNFNTDTA